MASSLINNGDFESGTSNWSFTSSGSGVSSETETIANTYCNIATTESIYQTIGVQAGEEVIVVLTSRGVVPGTVSLMLQNSNTSYWSDEFNTSRSETWNMEVFSFTVDGAWAGPFVIHFQAAYSATATDAVEVDNIIVVG
ncbi:hypothetical protein [Cupriavidus campinensis]